MKRIIFFVLLLVLTVQANPPEYAVVVSKETRALPAWAVVVEALVKKHGAQVIEYEGDVATAHELLAKLYPRYACFVARPEEAGRKFVVAIHRLTRGLDDDPYTDLFWGIITGYDAADALRIAQHSEPLRITRGAAGTGLDMGAFEQAVAFDEGKQGRKVTKQGEEKCADDATAEIVQMLNGFKPQLFVTSGHATERDWQIGYSFRSGQFRCADGQLFGLNLQGEKFPVDSPEPKVYLPCGNCLIGHVDSRQAMALAWMHTGGAYQMAGYIVPTGYGYMGWGMLNYFVAQGGRFTFAESFRANNIALVHQLETREFGKNDRDKRGLNGDRDTVAFYGDPAWDARLAKTRPLAWTQTVTEEAGTYSFEIKTVRDGDWGGRPVIEFLSSRLQDIKIVEGADLKPVITDNFILVPLTGKFSAGQTFKITFKARRV